jgi:hypothetical protein
VIKWGKYVKNIIFIRRSRQMNEFEAIVKELIAHTSEEEWFEFKENWYEEAGIGEYISSMSNVAAMLGKDFAYLVWGV